MKVLGISGSGRRNSYSTEVVQDILGEISCDTEFVPLADKHIKGCLGCLQCAADNVCVQKDDFQEILDQLFEADVVVFAGPNYFGSLNALSLAFWERTFCLIHHNDFKLEGKLAVAIALERVEAGPALSHIKKMMDSQKMTIIETYHYGGRHQCYDCGYGHECKTGSVYSTHGLCSPEYAEANRPLEYSEDIKEKDKVKALGMRINERLSTL